MYIYTHTYLMNYVHVYVYVYIYTFKLGSTPHNTRSMRVCPKFSCMRTTTGNSDQLPDGVESSARGTPPCVRMKLPRVSEIPLRQSACILGPRPTVSIHVRGPRGVTI